MLYKSDIKINVNSSNSNTNNILQNILLVCKNFQNLIQMNYIVR